MIHTGTVWTVLVHTEFSDLLNTWNSRPNKNETTGVLHVGFIHPPARQFEPFVEEYRGCLLVTTSAKFGLPEGFTASTSIVGFVENLPVHLGTSGWGYELSEERLITVDHQTDPQIETSSAIGWVRKFLRAEPNFGLLLRKYSIHNDRSYLDHESKLPFEARRSLGLFRFVEFVNGEMTDPCKVARASPPWLLSRTFDTIELPIRIMNVFRKSEIENVADLATTTFENLLGTANFGTKSKTHLLEALRSALDEGPFLEAVHHQPNPE